MTTHETALDAAFAAMSADPDAAGPRLRFYERVLDAELFVLLEAEVEGDRLRPRVFDTESGPYVVAFDRDARMAAFLDAPAPYAALSGRRLAATLAGRGVGLAINPGVAPSETSLDPAAMSWLAAVAAEGAPPEAARVREVGPPVGADADLVAALGDKLAAMAGLVEAAWLAELRFADGTRRLGLAIAGTPEAAETAVAAAIAETVRLSGGEETALDITFLAPGAAARPAFERRGLRIELTPPEPRMSPRALGGDPDRPPNLRR